MTLFRVLAVCGILTNAVAADNRSRVLEQYNQQPLSFEPNLGQTDSQVRYIARSAGYTLFLTGSGAVLRLTGRSGESSQDVGLRFENADAGASTVPLERQPGISAYFLGNDPSKWLPEVPHYARVRYKSVYPGIDVAYYGNGHQVEYDFIVSPGADPRRILLSYDGAQSVRVDRSGDLILATKMGDLRQRKPRVYQEIGGRRFEVAATYRLNAGKLAFDLASYDHRHALVIDPVLIYSTYLGGNTRIQDLAMDATGAVYVTGQTASLTYPTANASQSGFGGGISGDAFVTKLNAYSGTGPVTVAYSTYLGGAGYDAANGIAVDSAGAAYISGTTNDPATFPMANSYAQPVPNSGRTAGFVTKVAPYSGTGKVSLAYSTPLAGSSSVCSKIAVDTAGAAYAVGFTYTSDFPNVNGLLPFQAGDGFVARLNPYSGTGRVTLAYSTSLGSSIISGVAVDAAGAAYVAGSGGLNLITVNALQPPLSGGFVAKLNPFANGPVSLAYSTYVGDVTPTALAIDSAGGAYIAGYTNSPNLITVNAYQSHIGGNSSASSAFLPYDAFVIKVNPFTGGNVTLGFSTYLGGAAADFAYGIALDSAGSVYVTGTTRSPNYPILDTSPTAFIGPLGNAFITKLNPPSGNGPLTLAYSTLLGGAVATAGGNYFPDTGTGIAVDSIGAIQVAGYTSSPSFPLQNAFQTTFIDAITDALLDSDGFVARLPKPGTIVKTPANVTISSSTVSALAAGQHIVYGQPVTLTATFSAPATGTVSFVGSNLGGLLCSAQLAGGIATCVAPGSSELMPGTNTVTIVYSGDTIYTLGTVASLTFPVDKASTTTVLSTSPAIPVAGPVTLTATVGIALPAHVFQTPSGTVTFSNNGLPINGCTARPLTNFCFNNCPSAFTATCATVLSSGAGISLGASYSGDSLTAGSISPPLQVGKPMPVAVSPAAGSSSVRNFVFSDRGDLGVVNILINDVLDGRRACYMAYSRPLNTFYLVNDTGDALLPGVSLNSGASVGNSQCTVSEISTAPVVEGVFALSLNITFSSTFAGNKVIYLAAGNIAGDNSGWLPMGVWQATAGGVSVVSMTPASGAGLNQTFTFTFSDNKGWQDLGVVNVLINDAINGNHACYLAYSRPANTLYLVNDAGNALLPGVPVNGQALSYSNGQCGVLAAFAAPSGINTLTMTLTLSFSPAFSGKRIFYLAARDINEANNTGWQAMGAWSVQ